MSTIHVSINPAPRQPTERRDCRLGDVYELHNGDLYVAIARSRFWGPFHFLRLSRDGRVISTSTSTHHIGKIRTLVGRLCRLFIEIDICGDVLPGEAEYRSWFPEGSITYIGEFPQ